MKHRAPTCQDFRNQPPSLPTLFLRETRKKEFYFTSRFEESVPQAPALRLGLILGASTPQGPDLRHGLILVENPGLWRGCLK
mmetsp:Transcript_41471/g.57816  ORF Transcript_41471/g.57816 Transcript_41471/m.57816 type:complete len:82 (+) Transcript_41471:146-391(+)